jgi:hypothetical protein
METVYLLYKDLPENHSSSQEARKKEEEERSTFTYALDVRLYGTIIDDVHQSNKPRSHTQSKISCIFTVQSKM